MCKLNLSGITGIPRNCYASAWRLTIVAVKLKAIEQLRTAAILLCDILQKYHLHRSWRAVAYLNNVM